MPGNKSKKAKARKNSSKQSKPSNDTDSSSVKQHSPADPLAAEFCKIFEDLQNNNKNSMLDLNIKKTMSDDIVDSEHSEKEVEKEIQKDVVTKPENSLVKEVEKELKKDGIIKLKYSSVIEVGKEILKDVITKLEYCEKVTNVVVEIGSDEGSGEEEVKNKNSKGAGVKDNSPDKGEDFQEKANCMKEVMKETVQVTVDVVDGSGDVKYDVRDDKVTLVEDIDANIKVKASHADSETGAKSEALLEVNMTEEIHQKTNEEVSEQKCEEHSSNEASEAGGLKKRRICSVLKHPLAHSWTFWHLNPDKRLSWAEKQKEIMSVSTVEDFWAVYNWILQPSKLKASSDYSLFRTGIRPDWEDAGNVRGGRWVVARNREALDDSWREVIMALIGNTLGEGVGEVVTGAVVNVRMRGDKVAVWEGEGMEGSVRGLGDRLAQLLGVQGQGWGKIAHYKRHE